MILGRIVRLRALERSDLQRAAAWLNDPDVTRTLTLYTPLSLAAEERWFEKQLDTHPASQVLAIEARLGEGELWTHVGQCALVSIDWKDRWAELGIVIGEKAAWDRGIGTDATRTLLRYAFDTLNLHRVQLRVYSDNARAQRCYEKAGLALEGRLRESRFCDGRYLDTLLMGVLRGEFRASVRE